MLGEKSCEKFARARFASPGPPVNTVWAPGSRGTQRLTFIRQEMSGRPIHRHKKTAHSRASCSPSSLVPRRFFRRAVVCWAINQFLRPPFPFEIEDLLLVRYLLVLKKTDITGDLIDFRFDPFVNMRLEFGDIL